MLVATTLRERVRRLVDSRRFQFAIIGIILVNALILGIQTYQGLPDDVDAALEAINVVVVGIFVVEIALRIYGHGWGYFRDPWGWFDLIIVLIALIPGGTGAAVLRVLRALRILRLLSTVRSMRMVVGALVAATPGIISIGALVTMVMYIYAVIATTLFQSVSPQHFGDLGISSASLFRVMMGDGWPDIVEPIATNVWVWVFFISFTVVTSLVVLNLFIAVVVQAIEREHREAPDAVGTSSAAAPAVAPAVAEELRLLREHLTRLESRLEQRD